MTESPQTNSVFKAGSLYDRTEQTNSSEGTCPVDHECDLRTEIIIGKSVKYDDNGLKKKIKILSPSTKYADARDRRARGNAEASNANRCHFFSTI